MGEALCGSLLALIPGLEAPGREALSTPVRPRSPMEVASLLLQPVVGSGGLAGGQCHWTGLLSAGPLRWWRVWAGALFQGEGALVVSWATHRCPQQVKSQGVSWAQQQLRPGA